AHRREPSARPGERYFRPTMDECSRMTPAVEPLVFSRMTPAVEPLVFSRMTPAVEPLVRSRMTPAVEPLVRSRMTPAVEPLVRSRITDDVDPAPPVFSRITDDVDPAPPRPRVCSSAMVPYSRSSDCSVSRRSWSLMAHHRTCGRCL